MKDLVEISDHDFNSVNTIKKRKINSNFKFEGKYLVKYSDVDIKKIRLCTHITESLLLKLEYAYANIKALTI